MNRPALSQAVALFLLFLGTATAGATTRTVINLGDSGGGTLRDAIAASADGDAINFSVTGQIKLTSGTLKITNSITISGPGAQQLEVTRTGGVFRIFTIENGGTVRISGIAITNGHAADDGSNPGGPGTEAVKPGSGGGIFTFGGSVIISNCILSGNTADYLGGGIYNGSGQVTVTNSTLSNNDTTDSPPTMSGGGAIFNASILTLDKCTLNDNSTHAARPSSSTQFNGGGALFNYGGSTTMTDCTLSANNTTSGLSSSGGGIYNTTGAAGGSASVIIHHCTLSENASSVGGGICNQGTTGVSVSIYVDNTIVFSSGTTPGANVFSTGGGAVVTSGGYNLSSDDGGGLLNHAGDQINTDPKLGPLQNNGGPTQTMTLLAGSPAIDKGANLGVSNDQRGLSRTVDIITIPNAPGGDGTDIGAVETDAVETGPNFVVSSTDDHDDGTCSYADCTLREAVRVSNAAAGATTITFIPRVLGTITLTGSGLTISKSCTITGPGARLLTVSGNGNRVFYFGSGTNAISGLTIREGLASGAVGTGSGALGGGIYNADNSTLTVTECALVANHAQGSDNTITVGANGGSGSGGAIANSGTLTLERCTFSGNVAQGGRAADGTDAVGGNTHGGTGGAAQGGAVFNATGATLTINNCSFGGNTAAGGIGGAGPVKGAGGDATAGVFNLGTMTITAATFSANTGTGGPGGGTNMFNRGPSGMGSGGIATRSTGATVRDTISAGNTGSNSGGPDVDGTFGSGGYNLIGVSDAGTGFTAQGDKVGTGGSPINPQLGPLQNNGGQTDTFALSAGGPAVDSGKASFGSFELTVDQRGGQRKIDDPQVTNPTGGDGSDIGAYEFGGTPPAPPTVTTSAATNVTTTSATLNAMINPHGRDTTFNFTSDFAVFPTQQVGSGIGDVSFSVNVFGLTPNTTYHFSATATNVAGTTMGVQQTFTTSAVPTPTPPAQALNIATRMQVQGGDNVLIAGFIVSGNAPKTVAVRGIGPSLAQYFDGTLSDPTLELHGPAGLSTITDDNWQDDSSQAAQLRAYNLALQDPNESGIVATLQPGGYSAILAGKNNGSGVGLVEVYDLDQAADSQLANISTRGFVQSGNNVMIGGFILGNNSGNTRIAIRGIGPSLAQFGLSPVLADPTLELHDVNGTPLLSDDWQDDPAQAAQLSANGLALSDPKEAGIFVSLPPGQFTVILAGKNGGTGIGLLEIYNVH